MPKTFQGLGKLRVYRQKVSAFIDRKCQRLSTESVSFYQQKVSALSTESVSFPTEYMGAFWTWTRILSVDKTGRLSKVMVRFSTAKHALSEHGTALSVAKTASLSTGKINTQFRRGKCVFSDYKHALFLMLMSERHLATAQCKRGLNYVTKGIDNGYY